MSAATGSSIKLFVSLVFVFGIACGGYTVKRDDPETDGRTGGATGTGGLKSTGGRAGTGGAVGTGGTSATGGRVTVVGTGGAGTGGATTFGTGGAITFGTGGASSLPCPQVTLPNGKTGGAGGQSGFTFEDGDTTRTGSLGTLGGTGNCTAAELSTYESCLQKSCAGASSSCFDATTASAGTAPCSRYERCVNACPCADDACRRACDPSACTACMAAPSSCGATCTPPACLFAGG